jgi:peptidoglycan/xylan/chitin deacetylase (PgdA/CDA1 family)
MAETKLPAGWPEGGSLAVAVNVMLEGWTDDSAPGIGPMGNPLKPGVQDLQARSWAEYGPKTGAARLIDLLGAAGLRAVWYTSGIVAERYPRLMADIANGGHVVAAHGWAQNILPAYQSAAEEEADLGRCTSTLQATAGERPHGWLSPRCTPSPRTTTLLAGAGYRWHADFFDMDVPRVETTAAGPIVAMPFTMEVNDMPLYVRYGSEPEAYSRVFERIAASWPAIGGRPGVIDLTVHAHVFGRPYGLVELQAAIEAARRYEWAWLTDHAHLASLSTGSAAAA